jgi:hypothetical protein
MTGNERRALLAGALFALGLTAARGASAQGLPKIVAEELFTDGRTLYEAGQIDAACPKLEESERLDPAGGTALLLGLCLEKQGKLASAWSMLHSARAMATRDNREDRLTVADERLKAIAPLLAHVRIYVPPAIDAPGLRVFFDGVEMVGAARDTAVPVDPGPHELRATFPGHPVFIESVTVPSTGGVTPAVVGPLPENPAAPDDGGGPRLVPVLAFGGLSVAAFGVMTYFGIEALNAEKNKQLDCQPSDTSCLNQEQTTQGQRNTDATASTVAGVVGVAAAGAAVVFLLWPHHAATTGRTWTVTPFAKGGGALSVTF